MNHNTGSRKRIIGNPVKIWSGPAAVIRDESRKKVTIQLKFGWEGAVSRVI